MRVLLVADGRSPITMRFAQGLRSQGLILGLVSTYNCQPDESLFEEVYILPVAYGQISGSQVQTKNENPTQPAAAISTRTRLISRFRNTLQTIRYIFGPLTIPATAKPFRAIVEHFQPDLVHALRIPFEGMLASNTPSHIPLIASIWGNDITLHAHGSAAMRKWTQRVIQRADGIAADAHRDIRLAQIWGYPEKYPQAVYPGNGGLDLALLQNSTPTLANQYLQGWLKLNETLIINPRGFRPGSVRNDVFFAALHLLSSRLENMKVVCPAMANQVEAQEWVTKYGLQDKVRLLPYLSQDMLWSLFARSAVSVSISQHDGTPNSLLEAMAIGCLPIAGDIESIREWVIPGVNGLLVEPHQADSLADAIAFAVEHPEVREKGKTYNHEMSQLRVSREVVLPQILEFYTKVIKEKHRRENPPAQF
ncbi:MAG: glycosyltransferase [Anaerolineaceae bacterium]|nr:glycosyltransferase [Anaerolineaceae bacterium]